jgi:hypothetical protein
MSNAKKVKRPRKPAAWIRRQVRQALACPCMGPVRVAYDDDGELVGTVDHAEGCEAVPKRHRDADEYRYTVKPVPIVAPLNGGLN